MRYKRPTDAECVDILDDEEVLFLDRARARLDGLNPALRRVRERAAMRRYNRMARRKAWRLHKEGGPAGQLHSLTVDHCIGASVLLRGYTSTRQVAPIAASVAQQTTARFRCKVERHDLSDAPIGVRVTLTGFGDAFDSSDGS
jgi:hypothetical protein